MTKINLSPKITRRALEKGFWKIVREDNSMILTPKENDIYQTFFVDWNGYRKATVEISLYIPTINEWRMYVEVKKTELIDPVTEAEYARIVLREYFKNHQFKITDKHYEADKPKEETKQ